MGVHKGQVTKRGVEAGEAKKLAKDIYLELHKLTGKPPTDKKVVEHLEKQGVTRTVASIAAWRKADGWAPKPDPLPAVKAFYAEGDGLMPYEAHPTPEDTVDLLVSCLSVHQRAARVFLGWADAVDPRTLSAEQALKFAELIARNRETIESCTMRLAAHRAFIDRELSEANGMGRNGNGQTIEHDNISLPKATEAQIERSRIAGEQARKILAEAQ
jgi:hypothetical protein